MYESIFLSAETLDALGATKFSYPKRFVIAAATSLGGAPGTAGSGNITIQGGQPFLCERQYITFPTTFLEGADLQDDYVCRLSLQLKKNTSLQLYDAAVNLALYAVPGRVAVPSALTVDGTQPEPGTAPNIPGTPFFLYLAPGTKFEHAFENLSNAPATVDVMYDGWALNGDFDTDEKFWKVVRQHQKQMRAY